MAKIMNRKNFKHVGTLICIGLLAAAVLLLCSCGSAPISEKSVYDETDTEKEGQNMINIDGLSLTELSYGYSHMALGSGYSYHLKRTYSGTKFAALYWPRDGSSSREVFICVPLDRTVLEDVAAIIRSSGGAGSIQSAAAAEPILDAPTSSWYLVWSDGTKSTSGNAGGEIINYLTELKKQYADTAEPRTEENNPFKEHEHGYNAMSFDDETMSYIDELNDRYREKGLDPQNFRNTVSYESYLRRAVQLSAFLLQLKAYEDDGIDPVDVIESIMQMRSNTAGIQTKDLIDAAVDYGNKGLEPAGLLEYLHDFCEK